MATYIRITNVSNGWNINHSWDCDEGGMDESTSVYQESQAEEAIKHIKELMRIEE